MLNFVIETEFKSVATLINNYDKKKKTLWNNFCG